MSLIEGIGDEVVQFFVAVFVVVIVYIAWWSTNITEQRHYRTVLLLDRRRRTTRSIIRVRLPRQLTNHTETVTISEGSSSISTTSLSSEDPTESSDITSTVEQSNSESQSIPKPSEEPSSSNNSETTIEENQLEIDQRDIIETMDADQNVVRQRRLAHFENSSETTVGIVTDSIQAAPNRLPHSSNSEIVSSVIMPENVENKDNNEDVRNQVVLSNNSNQPSITIKLKYINDDMKIVDGKLEELLGDFKKRHFDQEINSNKIVRLIFNGQVLKQDRQTLQSCGLFDNCVVHCLIHQKRSTQNDELVAQENNSDPNSEFFGMGVTNLNNNNQGIDWDLGNFLFTLISFILLAFWYCRYVYAHLYTMTATVGLTIITGIFSIVLVGMYFPDNEQLPNTRIRIARAERVEVQNQQ